MIDLGIRIEFFDAATVDVDQRRLLGALCRPNGYLALAVPAIGSRLSASSLRLTSRDDFRPFVLGSTLRVCDVVHQPAPRRQGRVPDWWGDSPQEPTATVVLRAALRGSSLMLLPQIRQFAADGWSLQDPTEGSELERAWHKAQQQVAEQWPLTA
ncbi:hypothetical protein [Streptomyces sp. NPDC001787]|uniref:hypothetical protein n=1 Tax=Streptomyces sp. NPDC001787 TaxID=3154523 RepID=UPI003316A25B